MRTRATSSLIMNANYERASASAVLARKKKVIEVLGARAPHQAGIRSKAMVDLCNVACRFSLLVLQISSFLSVGRTSEHSCRRL